jgi:DNA anti-recombination protein RmuC
MNSGEMFLIILLAITIPSIVTYLINKHFIKNHIRKIERSSEDISTVSSGIIQQSNTFTQFMATTIQNLQGNLNIQFKELRDMQRDLSKTQRDTQGSFDKFVKLVRMNPQTKGKMGEGLIRWVLSSLPQSTWKEQVKITGGQVDFVIYLPPNQEQVLIDSKFSFPPKLLDTGNHLAATKKTIKQINSNAQTHGKKLQKYLAVENTNVGFMLMYILDYLYSYLNESTFKFLSSKRINVVNLSGLLSTLFIISRQIETFRIGKAIERLDQIKSFFNIQIEKLQDLTNTGKKQFTNGLKNFEKIDQQLEATRGGILQQFGLIEEEKGIKSR